jgi:hypothetical protein
VDYHLSSVTRSNMMTLKLWKKLPGEKNAFMSSKDKSPLSRRLEKTRRNSRWIRGRRELSHPFSETVLKDNQVLESPGRPK